MRINASSHQERRSADTGLEHQVVDTKTAAGIDKHLHDARGTFGTRLRKAGLTAPDIADVLAWEEDRVERLLATYVDQEAIVLALAKRIEQSEKRTGSAGKRRGAFNKKRSPA